MKQQQVPPGSRPPIQASSCEPTAPADHGADLARSPSRLKRALANAFSLTHLGVNLVTLAPGKRSSLCHWHTHEDEFVYVIEGELVLCTEAAEFTLVAGMCAGFQAGVALGHHLMNRSERPASYLDIGNRDSQDSIMFAGLDLAWNLPFNRGMFTHRDGSPFSMDDSRAPDMTRSDSRSTSSQKSSNSWQKK